MMAAVPTADVVVTNPTHFAVALRYDSGTRGAPRSSPRARTIVALRDPRARRASTASPVVPDPPLARALLRRGRDRPA